MRREATADTRRVECNGLFTHVSCASLFRARPAEYNWCLS